MTNGNFLHTIRISLPFPVHHSHSRSHSHEFSLFFPFPWNSHGTHGNSRIMHTSSGEIHSVSLLVATELRGDANALQTALEQ